MVQNPTISLAEWNLCAHVMSIEQEIARCGHLGMVLGTGCGKKINLVAGWYLEIVFPDIVAARDFCRCIVPEDNPFFF